MRLVDLLSSCAEGEGRYVESLCQTLMSVEEIITTLNNRYDSKEPLCYHFSYIYILWQFYILGEGVGIPQSHIWGTTLLESGYYPCLILSFLPGSTTKHFNKYFTTILSIRNCSETVFMLLVQIYSSERQDSLRAVFCVDLHQVQQNGHRERTGSSVSRSVSVKNK